MRRWLLAALAAQQMGCAMKVIRDESPTIGEQKIYKLNSFLWAFVPGTKMPPANEICPGGQVRSFDLGMDTTDALLTLVTAGIFVPHRAWVNCSAKN